MLRRASQGGDHPHKENGVDSFLVETYFGTYYQVEKVFRALCVAGGRTWEVPYGVNCLNVDAMGFGWQI